jgi:hypothetical protein
VFEEGRPGCSDPTRDAGRSAGDPILGIVSAVAGRIEALVHGRLGRRPVVGMKAGHEGPVCDRLIRADSPDLAHALVPLDHIGDHIPVVDAEPSCLLGQTQPLLGSPPRSLAPSALGDVDHDAGQADGPSGSLDLGGHHPPVTRHPPHAAVPSDDALLG